MERIGNQIIIDKANELLDKSAEYERIAIMVASGERVKDGYRYISEPEHYIGVAAGLHKAALSVLRLKQ